jgi:hypothetical protein
VAIDQRLDLVEVPDRLRAAGGVGLDDLPRSSVPMTRWPRRFSSTSTVDFPLPDMPVTSTTDRTDPPSLCLAAGLPSIRKTA